MNSIVVPVSALDVIKSCFPLKTRAQIATIVEQAYPLTKEAIKHTTILNSDLGKRHEGYLRPLAIAFLIQQSIDRGELQCTYDFDYNRNKSHKFIVIEKGNARMTISQVDNKNKIARPAYFRKKKQVANQAYFNYGGDPVSVDDSHIFHLLLTFSSGGDMPQFINIGMPGEKGWIERIDILNEMHILPSLHDYVEPEVTIEPEQLIELKKFIEKVEGNGS
ncbi:hypothetical protein PCCS19_34570 [Paenibacillus sp. CCS19]|uniref:hypothetical protein n=1 Tax=Paenibacillus sp. CCS19 TaxID=3158387 RepID=UPI002569A174|nr:hypothetical protein [Paenibacillus cellulosilyticus]GMK40401.1 hypothetical protein PCCS19_34570 [Paenibacillus cellulosilyticus]